MIRDSDFSGKQFLFLATGFKSQAKIFFFLSLKAKNGNNFKVFFLILSI